MSGFDMHRQIGQVVTQCDVIQFCLIKLLLQVIYETGYAVAYAV